MVATNTSTRVAIKGVRTWSSEARKCDRTDTLRAPIQLWHRYDHQDEQAPCTHFRSHKESHLLSTMLGSIGMSPVCFRAVQSTAADRAHDNCTLVFAYPWDTRCTSLIWTISTNSDEQLLKHCHLIIAVDIHATGVGMNAARRKAAKSLRLLRRYQKVTVHLRSVYVIADDGSQCHSTFLTSYFVGRSDIENPTLQPLACVADAAALTARPLQNAVTLQQSFRFQPTRMFCRINSCSTNGKI